MSPHYEPLQDPPPSRVLYGCFRRGCHKFNPDYLSFGTKGGKGYCLDHIPLRYRIKSRWWEMEGVGVRYRGVRWVLVQLRRFSLRYHVNFDNAVESSAKDVRR